MERINFIRDLLKSWSVPGQLFVFLLIALVQLGCTQLASETVAAPIVLSVNEAGTKVVPPERGMYHGLFPDFNETMVTGWGEKILSDEQLIQKKIGFVTYQNDFVDGFEFPKIAIEEISAQKKIPLIRMMPRSRRVQFQGADPIYTMEKFLAGEFDDSIRRWAQQAKEFGGPLMVEFGPEVNGMWYSWNGKWNGGEVADHYGDLSIPDGPERFRDTYRRIIQIFRAVGTDNITWAFHIDSQPIPDEPWNQMKYYYPGDEFIDWIGVSVFGAQSPTDWYGPFGEILGAKWSEVTALSSIRPIAILEWAVVEHPIDREAKSRWIAEALSTLQLEKFSRIKALSYWNEHSWKPGAIHNFRVDSSPQALAIYQKEIAAAWVLPEVNIKKFEH